jgi:hypothetical protein
VATIGYALAATSGFGRPAAVLLHYSLGGVFGGLVGVITGASLVRILYLATQAGPYNTRHEAGLAMSFAVIGAVLGLLGGIALMWHFRRAGSHSKQ